MEKNSINYNIIRDFSKKNKLKKFLLKYFLVPSQTELDFVVVGGGVFVVVVVVLIIKSEIISIIF